MKPMTDKHLAILRRHMVDVIGIHADLLEEELGKAPPPGPRIEFAPLKQPSGKIITAFAVRGDLDLDGTFSNTFELEWPKGSGNIREVPEIDRVGWFSVAEAGEKLLKGQRPLLDRLTAALGDVEPDASR